MMRATKKATPKGDNLSAVGRPQEHKSPSGDSERLMW
jgi:hypothetical protein